MEKRYIGIDLHRNRFTCCIRLENGRTYLREWALKDLARFVKELRASDEVAVGSRATHGCSRRGGAAGGTSGGGGYQSVSRHQPIVEKDRPPRRAAAVTVSVEGIAAGGAHEG
jgi:hypothetical protein